MPLPPGRMSSEQVTEALNIDGFGLIKLIQDRKLEPCANKHGRPFEQDEIPEGPGGPYSDEEREELIEKEIRSMRELSSTFSEPYPDNPRAEAEKRIKGLPYRRFYPCKVGRSWRHIGYEKKGKDLDPVIDEAMLYQYKIEDVERLKEEKGTKATQPFSPQGSGADQPIVRLSQTTRKNETTRKVFPCDPGTRWEDITMTLCSTDMIKVETPKGSDKYNYKELGFADGRKPDRPIVLWGLLRVFIKKSGRVDSWAQKYDPKLPDYAKRLDSHLKKIFGINERVYKHHYKKEKAYVMRIPLVDRTETTLEMDRMNEDREEDNIKRLHEQYGKKHGV